MTLQMRFSLPTPGPSTIENSTQSGERGRGFSCQSSTAPLKTRRTKPATTTKGALVVVAGFVRRVFDAHRLSRRCPGERRTGGGGLGGARQELVVSEAASSNP